MRIDIGVSDCVVFVGDAPNGPESFSAKGTAFLVIHDGYFNLVTAQHIASTLGDAPFYIRFNLKTGGTETVHVDPLAYHPHPSWYFYPDDPAVDIAVMPLRIPRDRFVLMGIGSNLIPSADDEAEFRINGGDLCYAVGLFRLLQGQQRNMPIVHTGTIALMAGEERIPIRDWRRKGLLHAEAHLVHLQNLKGLSGAPVFARPIYGQRIEGPRGDIKVCHYSANVCLLGVWSGSWEAKPDEVLALDHGEEVRVPVGFGTVAPAKYLRNILDLPEMIWLRSMFREVEKLANFHG